MSTAERVLEALKNHDLKQKGKGKYRANSPLREGSNSHAFQLTIKDGEHGAYFDHITKDTGSLYNLADKLGVERPTASTEEVSSKRAYTDLADYAQAHGVPVEVFEAVGWYSTQHDGRPALAFETATGRRHRYIDGQKPTYKSPLDYKRCWYGLKRAIHIAEATDQPLVICNGEASTIAAQHHGVAAIGVAGGGENGIPENLLVELQAVYNGPVLIALDCDQAGKTGSIRMIGTLRTSGYDVRALDLNGHTGFDLADFAQLHGDDTPTALQRLKDLPNTTPTRRYLTENEIDTLRPPTWLVKKVLAAGEVTLVSGAGDAGKTFLLTDMNKRVAQHYPVMYCALEDAPGIRIRKRAWELHHQMPKNGNFMMWTQALDLFDTVSVDAFIAEVLPLGLRLITLDTLSRALGGADENSNTDMAIVMNNCERIAHQTGAAVVIIHHTTKDGQAYRGASALKNNTYGHLEVSRDDDLIQFKIGRIKNTPEAPSRYFKLVTVELPDIIDDDGKHVSSAVILPADRVASGDTLTGNQVKMLASLMMITDAQGGAATTELEKTTGLVGNSFYSALKRLRTLGLVDKGEKRTDPLYITPTGRTRLARESSNPEHQQPGNSALDASPPFEVNTRLGELLPLLPGSNPLLPNDVGSSELLPNDPGSNDGSNTPQNDPSDGQSSHAATTQETRQGAVTTIATRLLPSIKSSNDLLTTTSLSPYGEGVGSNRGSKESDIDHDRRRENEVETLLAQRKFKEAKKVASYIRGRMEQLRVEARIEAAETAVTP